MVAPISGTASYAEVEFDFAMRVDRVAAISQELREDTVVQPRAGDRQAGSAVEDAQDHARTGKSAFEVGVEPRIGVAVIEGMLAAGRSSGRGAPPGTA